ncbi:hypothetical protein Fmac_004631 [Flemingia macrophylla]|uniref:Uncharacterized protein n=1 Tax=Flemingia macrophylla TaxID=520843 RepID=A0ABD1N5G3_9FABA
MGKPPLQGVHHRLSEGLAHVGAAEEGLVDVGFLQFRAKGWGWLAGGVGVASGMVGVARGGGWGLCGKEKGWLAGVGEGRRVSHRKGRVNRGWARRGRETEVEGDGEAVEDGGWGSEWRKRPGVGWDWVGEEEWWKGGRKEEKKEEENEKRTEGGHECGFSQEVAQLVLQGKVIPPVRMEKEGSVLFVSTEMRGKKNGEMRDTYTDYASFIHGEMRRNERKPRWHMRKDQFALLKSKLSITCKIPCFICMHAEIRQENAAGSQGHSNSSGGWLHLSLTSYSSYNKRLKASTESYKQG